MCYQYAISFAGSSVLVHFVGKVIVRLQNVGCLIRLPFNNIVKTQ